MLEKLWGPRGVPSELERTAPLEIEDLWQGDIPYFSARPGELVVGLAGIGYNLLRFADPDRVPSVLCREGPRPSRQA